MWMKRLIMGLLPPKLLPPKVFFSPSCSTQASQRCKTLSPLRPSQHDEVEPN